MTPLANELLQIETALLEEILTAYKRELARLESQSRIEEVTRVRQTILTIETEMQSRKQIMSGK